MHRWRSVCGSWPDGRSAAVTGAPGLPDARRVPARLGSRSRSRRTAEFIALWADGGRRQRGADPADAEFALLRTAARCGATCLRGSRSRWSATAQPTPSLCRRGATESRAHRGTAIGCRQPVRPAPSGALRLPSQATLSRHSASRRLPAGPNPRRHGGVPTRRLEVVRSQGHLTISPRTSLLALALTPTTVTGSSLAAECQSGLGKQQEREISMGDHGLRRLR